MLFSQRQMIGYYIFISFVTFGGHPLLLVINLVHKMTKREVDKFLAVNHLLDKGDV